MKLIGIWIPLSDESNRGRGVKQGRAGWRGGYPVVHVVVSDRMFGLDPPQVRLQEQAGRRAIHQINPRKEVIDVDAGI